MEKFPEEWLTEFETEDQNPVLIDKMDILDDLTPQHFEALFNEYRNIFTTSSNVNAVSSQICNERPSPIKKLKSTTSDSMNSGTTEQRSSSSSESFSFPDVLSIGNSVNSAKSKVKSLNQNKKVGKQTARTSIDLSLSSSATLDHAIAERKRREKLTQQFIALSALVPGIKKMDKVSVLGDCMTYIKNLQARLKTLEEQTSKKTIESAVFVRNFNVSSNTDDTLNAFSQEPLPEVQARVSERNVLLRIHCEKHKGVLAHTLVATEQLNLIIISSNVLPFGNSTFEITVLAQMEADFNLTVKDLVKKLHSSIDNFMTTQG